MTALFYFGLCLQALSQWLVIGFGFSFLPINPEVSACTLLLLAWSYVLVPDLVRSLMSGIPLEEIFADAGKDPSPHVWLLMWCLIAGGAAFFVADQFTTDTFWPMCAALGTEWAILMVADALRSRRPNRSGEPPPAMARGFFVRQPRSKQ